MSPKRIEPRAERELIIVFTDLTRFAYESTRMDDAALAVWVDQLYERIDLAVTSAGGRLVKFIGDASLSVFPPEGGDAAVAAHLALKEEVDRWMEETGRECRLFVKIHCGRCWAGPFGGRKDKRFDVIGREVNACARLPGTGFSLSPAAFRKLSSGARRRFRKHALPRVS